MSSRPRHLARLSLGFSLGLLLLPGPTEATGRWARRTGEGCISCHLDARGAGPLNDRGQRLAGAGHRRAFDPELTATGAPTPLSSGGATMVLRRYRDLGQRLFRMRDLGASRRSCLDCHSGARALGKDLWQRYPRFSPEQGHWISLGDAIDHCLRERMGTQPLRPGSRSLLALQTFLRTQTPPGDLDGGPGSPVVPGDPLLPSPRETVEEWVPDAPDFSPEGEDDFLAPPESEEDLDREPDPLDPGAGDEDLDDLDF